MKKDRQNSNDFIANFSGSVTPNFLKVAFNELMIYRTPKKIIDYIKSENMKKIEKIFWCSKKNEEQESRCIEQCKYCLRYVRNNLKLNDN